MKYKGFENAERVFLRASVVVIVTLLLVIGWLTTYIFHMTAQIELIQSDQAFVQSVHATERLEAETSGQMAEESFLY